LRLLEAIHGRVCSASGCFDVYCWRGNNVLVAESKRKTKDSIRETQLVWLEATAKVARREKDKYQDLARKEKR
jgi:hypothetical protein